MAKTVEQLDIEIGARGASGVEMSLSRIAESLENVGQKSVVAARGTKQADESFKGMLKSINADFGKKSALGMSLKLLAGGGAIAGISMALDKIKQMTEAMLDMQEAMAKGEMGWRQMTSSMVSTIPLMGQAYEITSNIIGLMTNEGSRRAWEAKQLAADQSRAKGLGGGIEFLRGSQARIAEAAGGEAYKRQKEISDLREDAQKRANALRNTDPELSGRILAQADSEIRDRIRRWEEEEAAEASELRKKHEEELNKTLKELTTEGRRMASEFTEAQLKSNGNALGAALVKIQADSLQRIEAYTRQAEALSFGGALSAEAQQAFMGNIGLTRRRANLSGFDESMKWYGDLMKGLAGSLRFDQKNILSPSEIAKAVAQGGEDVSREIRKYDSPGGPRLGGLYQSRFEIGQTTGNAPEAKQLKQLEAINKVMNATLDVLRSIDRNRTVVEFV